MIFAAGLGTRMGKLTAERPKPMIEVAGRRLIDHALAPVREMGLARIVVNLHYMPELLAAHLAGTEVLLSRESPDILETGGGLRAALPLLGPGPVYTMNSDAVWKGPNPLQVLLERWDPSAADALLLCIPKSRAVSHDADGDFRTDESGTGAQGVGHGLFRPSDHQTRRSRGHRQAGLLPERSVGPDARARTTPCDRVSRMVVRRRQTRRHRGGGTNAPVSRLRVGDHHCRERLGRETGLRKNHSPPGCAVRCRDNVRGAGGRGYPNIYDTFNTLSAETPKNRF